MGGFLGASAKKTNLDLSGQKSGSYRPSASFRNCLSNSCLCTSYSRRWL